jgi:hypothetical protein
MKSFTLILTLVAALTAGVFTTSEAQRGRGSSGGSSRGGGGGESRSSGFSPSRGGGNYSQPRQNNFSRSNAISSQRSAQTFSADRPNFAGRNAITRNDYRGGRPTNIPAGRGNFNGVASGYNRNIASSRSNNYYAYNGNRYIGGGRSFRSSYYTYNNRSYAFMYGPRYSVIPRNSVSIYFGGSPYYYNSGFFYGYYGGYYQPLFPPIGLRIGYLPYGYYSFYNGGYPYYYYNGIYYRSYDDNNYEVVDPPMGASVYSLPQGAKAVVLNGEKLYELNGTYYKEDRDSKGQTIYTVVGKNGQVNNTDDESNNNGNGDNSNLNGNNGNSLSAPPASLQMGDVVSQLPEGSKVVTINGEKMYVTPDNTYLKENSGDSGTVQYEVVGK